MTLADNICRWWPVGQAIHTNQSINQSVSQSVSQCEVRFIIWRRHRGCLARSFAKHSTCNEWNA